MIGRQYAMLLVDDGYKKAMNLTVMGRLITQVCALLLKCNWTLSLAYLLTPL